SSTGSICGFSSSIMSSQLPRVVLDHELLVEIERHLVAAGRGDDGAGELAGVDGQPLRRLMILERLLRDLEGLAFATRLADLELVARLELVRRDVRGDAVHGEVAMVDELAGGGARRREARPVDDVVEAQLERAQEVLSGDAGAVLGRDEVVPELALEHAVGLADLLLLAQLQAVLADLAATDAVLAGRGRTALEGALLRVAARALQEELGALTAADAADGFGVASHLSSGLDAASLGRATTVVRDGRDVGDGADLEAGRLERTDRLLSAGARTLHVDLDLAHAMLHGTLRGAIGGQGRRVGRALARSLEPGHPGRAPADDRAVEVGDRDDRVVERGLDVNVPLGDVLLLTPPCLDRSLAFRHAWSVPRHFLRRTPTVFFGPRRWRAFVLVRWPRTGRLRRWRRPRYEPISMSRLMFSAVSRRRSPSTLYRRSISSR